MPRLTRTSLFITIWATAVVVLGAAFTSFHQPFRTPRKEALRRLVGSTPGRWQMVHILSASCLCSQRILDDLAHRNLIPAEQTILVAEDGTPHLETSDHLLATLANHGLRILHRDTNQIELNGVPLLLLISPTGHLAYSGGYGLTRNNDIRILAQLQGGSIHPDEPILGCAVGQRLRRHLDPLHLKYADNIQEVRR